MNRRQSWTWDRLINCPHTIAQLLRLSALHLHTSFMTPFPPHPLTPFALFSHSFLPPPPPPMPVWLPAVQRVWCAGSRHSPCRSARCGCWRLRRLRAGGLHAAVRAGEAWDHALIPSYTDRIAWCTQPPPTGMPPPPSSALESYAQEIRGLAWLSPWASTTLQGIRDVE